MKSYDLNEFPVRIKNGQLSMKDAVNEICSFVIQNYKVFNLQKYDEDFRSELVLSMLENGDKLINSYNPEIGDFFTFLYCYINSMISTRVRSLTQRTLKESVTFTEGINSFMDSEYNYSNDMYKETEIPRVPYSYKPANIEDLKQIFSNLKCSNNDKKILVLAMKSSYYISDEQINNICKMYNITQQDFYNTVQYFKNQMLDKMEKHSKAEERRNFAYYHHKRYVIQLEKLQENDTASYLNQSEEKIKSKKDKHEKNWKLMNEKLEHGYLYLRPSTKAVADMLGICERQVTYYINCARKEADKKNNKKV